VCIGSPVFYSARCNNSSRTPELTRAERAAFYLIGKDNGERDAIEASG
jgi:hypothetical protein